MENGQSGIHRSLGAQRAGGTIVQAKRALLLGIPSSRRIKPRRRPQAAGAIMPNRVAPHWSMRKTRRARAGSHSHGLVPASPGSAGGHGGPDEPMNRVMDWSRRRKGYDMTEVAHGRSSSATC